MSNESIKQVALVGGTHGNELTGIYLLNKYRQFPKLLGKHSFEVELFTANPEAQRANRRYIDRDLNRSFKQADLDDNSLFGHENELAKQINQKLGPKGSSRTDMIIDLHTSTAPMGVNLVLTKTDSFHLMLADYVQQRMDNVSITLEKMLDHHFLMSVAPQHVLVEIGATAQGQLRQDVFDKTEETTQLIFKFLNEYNQHQLPQPSESIDVYQYFDVMFLPTDINGDISGMIHHSIQDQDFTKLRSGQPIFSLFNGEEVLYEGEDCYMSFINEAAYYDEKKAFAMSQKKTFHIG
ncbi:aspartoacylase [Kangiella geojedonensis]|uniref:Aspartoacylase n=1 Tax=Kangiella geojedonensis TaxID=914150 RepID=A0A0F6TSI1_9GAMM|nr:aspartoacylase [Kangiella geojedonensis]AKE53077.1 Aspartoacylase [Kangiella geojedonensis]